MSEYPSRFRELLFAVLIESRLPAFLEMDRQGRLLRMGGELAHYRLDGLRAGKPAAEQVEWLQGLSPVQEECLHLPWLQIGDQQAIDLFLLRDGERDWALLLEATEEERQRQQMQQQANELSLRKEKQE